MSFKNQLFETVLRTVNSFTTVEVETVFGCTKNRHRYTLMTLFHRHKQTFSSNELNENTDEGLRKQLLIALLNPLEDEEEYSGEECNQIDDIQLLDSDNSSNFD